MQRFADLENYFEILIITVIYAHSELSSWDFNKMMNNNILRRNYEIQYSN